MELKVIARIRTDFPSKFGIPRQSGLAKTQAVIVFEPAYRDPAALRGLEEYSHLWLIWHFSANPVRGFSPTVRPPRLGGNKRMGVFATRSPFRPNPIGLSSVRLVGIERTEEWGTVLRVEGADLMDGTPILDIKPYLPYTDCHADAVGGFAQRVAFNKLTVEFPAEWKALLSVEKAEALTEILSEDPRPSYQEDAERIYGMPFAGFDVRFRVRDNVLTVLEMVPLEVV